MEANIKNEVVKEAISIAFEGNFNDINNDLDICMGTIAAYGMGLKDCAERNGFELDLSYDTAHNLKDTIAELWNSCGNGTDKRRRTMCKIISGYLILMAINENDCSIALGVNQNDIPDEMIIPPLEMWSWRYILRLSNKSFDGLNCVQEEIDLVSVDFLAICIKAIYDASEYMSDGCIVRLDTIAEAYKKATGVDLADYGMSGKLKLGLPIKYS